MSELLDNRQFFNRPPFDPNGKVVARREVKFGKVYHPKQEIPNHGLDTRGLAMLWDQGLIDTLPQEDPKRKK